MPATRQIAETLGKSKKSVLFLGPRQSGKSTVMRGLKSFSDFYGGKHQRFVFYLGEHEIEIDGIRVLPLAAGIRALF